MAEAHRILPSLIALGLFCKKLEKAIKGLFPKSDLASEIVKLFTIKSLYFIYNFGVDSFIPVC